MTALPACARCERTLGQSCCQVRPDEHLATLTLTDVARIREARGLAARRFVEEEWLTEEEAREYEQRRPLYRGYFDRGPVRLTLARREGACVFFQREGGCTLTVEERPTACRLYPFEQWPDGQWSLQVERFGVPEEARASGAACLAVEEANGMEDVLRAFSMHRAEVETLGRTLHGEVRQHARGKTVPLSPDAEWG